MNNYDEIRQRLDQMSFEGECYTDPVQRRLYATDASVYRKMPIAVVVPKTKKDLQQLIALANEYQTNVIPRTAGTSLAGQVVGEGIVVDLSKYWGKILEVNPEEKWVRVEPGVNLDELNQYLANYNLFFGPETSTSNRCRIGGMVGNNSCGSHSVLYGTTRDHLLELETILSNGEDAHFGPLDKEGFEAKKQQNGLEGELYRHIDQVLSKPENQAEIRKEYPKRSINRRNTGYAIDELLESQIYTEGSEQPFNFCKLLAGSEGTLAFTTEIKLNLVDKPPENVAVVAVHLNTIPEAMRANLVALRHKPGAVELMDKLILDCTKQNSDQLKNRAFVKGDPGAILIVELRRESEEALEETAQALISDMKSEGFGFHFPVLYGDETKKVWTLRKAGLGVLANIPGDAKGVACIEDTAVDVRDQPAYIDEFIQVLEQYGLECVFYAHIGDGEIHLRPVLDLKNADHRQLFHTITEEVAKLVKKYQGSLSGEHGDGRVRAEFVEQMLGSHNYQLLKELKDTWDPHHIFNPGKIVEAPLMNEDLRYRPGQATREFDTTMDFGDTMGILRLAEKCNGSGDCRKTHLIGGTMCPSYQATRNEKDTTRARANILREFLTNSEKQNPFDHEEVKEVFDLCLSCKGCKNECPSNVDVAKLKAEFQHQYYKSNGVPFSTWAIGNVARINALGMIWPGLTNFMMKNKATGSLLKSVMGVAQQRSLPPLHSFTLKKWWKRNRTKLQPTANPKGKLFFFADEFTQFNDVAIGMSAIKLLSRLGYQVEIPEHVESGRAYLSKGLLDEAKRLADKNVALLKEKIAEQTPLIGLEPSAILTFRDEYPNLVEADAKASAEKIGEHSFLIDEFLEQEMDAGRISPDQFKSEERRVYLHGHCHQKALSSVVPSKRILQMPQGYQVINIPSGCCGMAGSFGYEKDHYDISMQIGNLVLFPKVKAAEANDLIAAPGTSCRHQIWDGTQRKAQHPVEILYEALK